VNEDVIPINKENTSACDISLKSKNNQTSDGRQALEKLVRLIQIDGGQENE